MLQLQKIERSGTMELLEIAIKYLEASEKVKSQIDLILGDFQSPVAFPGEVSNTDQESA